MNCGRHVLPARQGTGVRTGAVNPHVVDDPMPGRSGRSDVANRLALGDDGSVAPCFAWSPVVVMTVRK